MALAAAACIIIGIFPALLYAHLPFPVEYAPYTVRHVLATLGLLSFTALGFFALLAHLDPEPKISLDTDWFYRRGLSTAAGYAFLAAARVEVLLAEGYEGFVRRPLLGAAARLRQIDASVVDRAAEGIGSGTDSVSQILRMAVTGHAQYYGLMMAAGVLMAIAIAMFAR
jgi:multicomponent Na+:H+ antiporter subunit D